MGFAHDSNRSCDILAYMILTSDLFFEEFIVYKEVLANSR